MLYIQHDIKRFFANFHSSLHCQSLSIDNGLCDLVGEYNSSLSNPLPFTDVSGGRLYTISFKNSDVTQ